MTMARIAATLSVVFLAGTSSLAGSGAGLPCNKMCYWNAPAFQCLAGSEGRDCVAQGTTCWIITSCGYTYFQVLSNGEVVASAAINGCERDVDLAAEVVLDE